MCVSLSTGAYNSIRESEERSRQAEILVESTTIIIRESMHIRTQIDTLIEGNQESWEEKYDSNEEVLNDLNEQADGMEVKIGELNEIVSG